MFLRKKDRTSLYAGRKNKPISPAFADRSEGVAWSVARGGRVLGKASKTRFPTEVSTFKW